MSNAKKEVRSQTATDFSQVWTSAQDALASQFTNVATQMQLVPEHLQELVDSGITEDYARATGVYSALSADELPMALRWVADAYGSDVFPALVYPMVEPDGTVKFQMKPWTPVTNSKGKPTKYISGKGTDSLELPCIREVQGADTVLIVEGTKQSRSAGLWAPEDVSIYMVAGIHSWMRDGSATEYLSVVEDKNVVIIPDADAASNLAVYNGAVDLGDSCMSFGAKSYGFVQLPGVGKDGLDDVLARLSTSKRTEFIADLMKNAKTKPAVRKPTSSASALKSRKEEVASTGLPVICVSEQPRVVTDACVAVLKDAYAGKIFSNAEGLVELVDLPLSGLTMKRLNESDIADLVARSANLVDERFKAQHLSRHVLHAIERCWTQFPPLDGVSTSPVVRSDWSIVTATGYDEATRLYVSLSEDLAGLNVPDSPTDDDITSARELLYELLESFAYQDVSDRAHMIAAMLALLVRTHLPTTPGFVFNGTQPASGKGVSANTVSQVVYGKPATMAPCASTQRDGDDEIRKQMSVSARNGDLVKFLDEVPALASKTLDRMLTSEVVEDRILGKSEMIRVPNKMVVFALGNNIPISADSARRFLQIRLAPDPHAEQKADYKHKLPDWAVDNRARLLGALLTLIRAYGVRGEPVAPKDGSLASFEKFQTVVGGILHVAGIPGFMQGWWEQRASADYVGATWQKHLEWLAEVTEYKPFFSSDIAKLVAEDFNDEYVMLPPIEDVDWTDIRKGSRALGTAWRSRVQGGAEGEASEGTWYGDIRIVKTGKTPKNRVEWQIERYDATDLESAQPEPAPVVEPEQVLPADRSKPDLMARAKQEPVVADLSEVISL